MNRIVFICGIILVTQSCKLVSIGTNGYDILSSNLKNEIIKKSLFQVDELSVPLFTSTQLDSIIISKPMVWIHFWVPYCEVLDFDSDFFAKAQKSDVLVLIISTRFDSQNLAVVAHFADTCSNVILRLPSVQYYGIFVDRMERQVNTQININTNFPDSRYGDFFFESGELQFAGWDMDENVIDSFN